MEHNFTGPNYTLGIGEELMILDSETLALANEIETLLKDSDEENGEIKRELMESVLEIAGGNAERLGLKPGDKVRHALFGTAAAN